MSILNGRIVLGRVVSLRSRFIDAHINLERWGWRCVRRPADFINCAGERKPHFIKCGLGDACHFEMVEVA